ncbi:MAG: hypothetical protein WDN45_17845 [Caulobacteraceae bacterium]
MSKGMTLAAGLLASAVAGSAFAATSCDGVLTLYNGKIHTMDARDTVVSLQRSRATGSCASGAWPRSPPAPAPST